MRADFENYRRQADVQKALARQAGREEAILKLLPVVDNIERATSQVPPELIENEWIKGVLGLRKNLETDLAGLGVTKVSATPGTRFDPNLHDAVQFDDTDGGETEVIANELLAGYLLDGKTLRHAMVRVTRR
jgi:molecular chaperone GrpE